MSISAPNGGKRSRSGSESGVAAADEQYRAAMPRWTIGVDTGGTFTDCIARSDDGVVCRAKVPSSGELRARVIACDGTTLELDGLPPVPAGFWMGFEVLLDGGAPVPVTADPQSSSKRRIMLASVPGHSTAPGSVARLRCACAAPVLAARIAIARPLHEPLLDVELRVGTTIGTNALLEGRTARVLLVTTAGLEDALLIGDQRRRDIFALAPSRRSPVTTLRAGVRERMSARGSVVTPLDAQDIDRAIALGRSEGADAVAVAFVHSSVNPSHERAASKALSALSPHAVASADVATSTAFLPRANAAVIEAALRPAIGAFVERLRTDAGAASIFLSASSGSPVPAPDYMAKDSLLSGPASGVAAAAQVAMRLGFDRCVTIDVGGTSADAARATGGAPDLARTTTVAGVELASPCVAVESVAAGGGSILWFDGTALRVGPRSAGAAPGPACYGAGGPLTLTDANLLLGRIDPAQMPIPIDPDAAARAAEALRVEVESARGRPLTREALLEECLAIADERMAGALRASLARAGESPRDHALVAFGGAGGLHACAIAELLDMPAVILPPDAGLLCAQGACDTPVQHEESRLVLAVMGSDGWHARARGAIDDALAAATAVLERWNVPAAQRAPASVTLSVRRTGQDEGLPIAVAPDVGSERDLQHAISAGFARAWQARFGTEPDDRPLEIEEVRVRCASARTRSDGARIPAAPRADGPMIRSRMGSTAWIPSGWSVAEHADGSAVLIRHTAAPESTASRGAASTPELVATSSPAPHESPGVSTERIASALAAAADEMGEQLRRTALSVNVRDRLDYSCGLLDTHGRLVVNAPHIPVHLGALGACVRAVCSSVTVSPGDVWCVNHPRFGGAHLPDVTVIAPVHERDDLQDPGAHLGFVAARAHHAEIGGTRPGSMPPDATRLAQEGIVIAPTRIVSRGTEHLADVERLLRAGPWPSRCPQENIADLRAQVAALVAGRDALRALAARAGAGALERACARIADASAAAARTAIGGLHHLSVGQPVIHEVQLDDGTPLHVRVVRPSPDALMLDFTGTGGPHTGNMNMPESVTRATILYVMRLLVARTHGRDGLGLPVAESLLDPVSITLPPSSILNANVGDDPAHAPAVAVGQTDTAQRLVDLLLFALGLAAESQGTMNNLLFGGADWGYYETICGGAGGSIDGPGADAIHTHLTNTRITDVEVLERRHPVRVERFAVRPGSGGSGAFPGGSGAVRAIRFLAPAAGSFLSQHRATAPRGLNGGGDGAPGAQRIEHPDGSSTALAGRAAFEARTGDLLVIETPGGGGFGTAT
jgi:5-oxoprolinase (ATP-hydrolysing)